MSASGHQSGAAWTASIVVLCATWWVFEPVPIPVTSLIPLAVFPLVGVLDADEIGESYGSPLVLLMMGGFMLSVAMERSNTHRRLALSMVHLFGGGGGRTLVFGFMAASALLSMWISNAATTLMLLPIVLAIVDKTKDSALQVGLLLGVAYAASIGGIGTPIGTPPNLIFMAEIRRVTGNRADVFAVDVVGIADLTGDDSDCRNVADPKDQGDRANRFAKRWPVAQRGNSNAGGVCGHR